MLLVVADASPIRYLVQIEQIELLPRLFGRVLIPTVVAQELRHPSAPAGVQAWMKLPPPWLETVHADLILIDDRKGATAATAKGLTTMGTIGVLDLGAEHGIVDLRATLDRLKTTNFRYRQAMLDELLEHREQQARSKEK